MSGLLSEYQTLLVSGESLTALNASIGLARRVAKGDAKGWISLIDSRLDSEALGKKGTRASISRLFDQVIWILSRLPSRLEERHLPDSQYRLLFDSLLLVFHQAYFALLPKLDSSDRQVLLNAFTEFSTNFPEIADKFRIKGLVELEQGRHEQATECFRAAMLATPSCEHDFLTRVQMLWSLLMEHHQFLDAFKLLRDASRRATRLDLDEVEQLLQTTFEEVMAERSAQTEAAMQ